MSQEIWWKAGFELFLKLNIWIGGPILVSVFFGKYLDRKFETTPWLFLLTVGIAFIFSMTALVFLGAREIKRIETESKKTKKN